MKRVPLNGVLLVVVVVLHLGVTAAHAMAHVLAQVTLSRLALSFVLTIVLIGPIVGLMMQRTYPRGGAWVIAGTLAAAFYFGLANHFFILGPDHVTQVTEAWRGLFETTAVLLALIEFFGSGVAVWCATREGGAVMRVFVGGGSGAIGIPLVRSLVKAKHQVTALTRSPEKQQLIHNLGATPAVADALDAATLRRVVRGSASHSCNS